MSSYSFGAGRGSEAGVGWNVAAGMAARGHEVCVVTTSEFHHLNVQALVDSGLHLRIVEFDAGLTHFNSSKSYKHWQKSVGPEIKRLAESEKFDLIHHVTFNQYRNIFDVFAVDLPYLIGPIGGAETVHPRFWKELPVCMALKEAARFLPWDIYPLKHYIQQSFSRGKVLASTPQTAHRLQHVAGVENVELHPIISVHDSEICEEVPQMASERYLVFDGGERPEKGLKLMLRALARMWMAGVQCPLKVAAVSESARGKIMHYAQKQGVPAAAVELLSFMPRSELLKLMKGACGFVSVGFRDAGCMALLEAVALGIPSVCLDIAGQHWLPDEYAIKVPVYGGCMEQRLAEAVTTLVQKSAGTAEWHAHRAAWMREHMSWRARLDYLEHAYNELVGAN